MGRVEQKIAIVTGGAQGLGEGIARRLAEEGAHVVVTDLNADAGQAVASDIGGRFMRQDVSSEAGWAEVISATKEEYGALHILVNNAGTEGSPDAPKDPEHAPLDD